MKLLYTVLLWSITSVIVYSQCSAVEVNNSSILQTGSSGGNCTYIVNANITLQRGNASVKVFYTCGTNATEMVLEDCFSWDKPSTKNFTSSSFTCPCEAEVSVRFIGYANPSCGGNACGEVGTINSGESTESQLALDLTNFKVEGLIRDQACFSWEVEPTETGTVFQLEKSSDGKSFVALASLNYRDIRIQGTTATYCMPLRGTAQYFRMKAVETTGKVHTSPVRFVKNKSAFTEVQFSPVSHQIRLVGDVDDLMAKPLYIYTAGGQLVHQQTINSDRIDLPQLVGGIYIVRIPQAEGPLVRKVII